MKEEESENKKENEKIETALLLEAIYRKYHYDFKDYSPAHLRRRILHRMGLEGIHSISQLQHQILYDECLFKKLLLDFSINVTEMFRDPHFYFLLRTKVFPALKNLSFIKIWNAGCASGEEVYSTAILLKELGLYNRSQIYATDFNPYQLKKAKEGIYPLKAVKEYAGNYKISGGPNSLEDYYSTRYESVAMDRSLKEKIVFADHNLVTDNVFSEINLVLCRNVLIYFSKKLQNRVIKLFLDSLAPRGFLCLGIKESLKFTEYEEYFETYDVNEKIYRLRDKDNETIV